MVDRLVEVLISTLQNAEFHFRALHFSVMPRVLSFILLSRHISTRQPLFSSIHYTVTFKDHSSILARIARNRHISIVHTSHYVGKIQLFSLIRLRPQNRPASNPSHNSEIVHHSWSMDLKAKREEVRSHTRGPLHGWSFYPPLECFQTIDDKPHWATG
jgi:hypothetical protein